jgi:probable HAF family extracellular repeat protein
VTGQSNNPPEGDNTGGRRRQVRRRAKEHWVAGEAQMKLRAWLLLAVALVAPRPAWGQAYQIVDMGVSEPYAPTALNNRGQVLLTNNQLTPARIGLFLASSPFLPRWSGAASLLWDNGGTSAIGLLPGGTYSRGCGLNDAGQVVGFGDRMTPYSDCPGDDFPSMALHAFIWSGGLADLDPGVKLVLEDGTECRAFIIPSLALGINNQGQVTGWLGSKFPSGDYNHGSLHAFRSAGGQVDHEADDLTPGAAAITQGWFINNAGAVLATQLGGGYSFLGGGGSVPPAGGIVYAMNDRGTTVGVAGGQAFVSGGAEPPKPFEAALGINNHGQIVGQGTVGGRQHALLYSDGEVVDLESELPAGSGWELFQGALINDQGQIVVWGSHNGTSTYGLLTPEAIKVTLQLPDKVCRDETATGTVRLSRPAPPGGTLVQLSSEPPLPELPLGVTVPPGQSEKDFSVAAPGPAGTTYQITASVSSGAGVSTATATLMVDKPHAQAVALSAPEFSSDDESTLTVTLSCPADPDGTEVTLDLIGPGDTTRLDVPDHVTVAAGQKEAKVMIHTRAGVIWSPISDASYTIKASAGGQSQSADFTVRPTLRDFILHTHSLTGYIINGVYAGETVTGVIQLSLPAPPGGRQVLVTSHNARLAGVSPAAADQPLPVVIPAGQDSVEITITTHPGATGQAEFEATTPTSDVLTQMTIVPAPQ